MEEQYKQTMELKCFNCIHAPLCMAQKGGVNLGLASENNCEYYQPKLPKDVIVLDQEEWAIVHQQFTESLENMQKETAKEILDKVSKHYGGAWLVELYKEYGIEV